MEQELPPEIRNAPAEVKHRFCLRLLYLLTIHNRDFEDEDPVEMRHERLFRFSEMSHRGVAAMRDFMDGKDGTWGVEYLWGCCQRMNYVGFFRMAWREIIHPGTG